MDREGRRGTGRAASRGLTFSHARNYLSWIRKRAALTKKGARRRGGNKLTKTLCFDAGSAEGVIGKASTRRIGEPKPGEKIRKYAHITTSKRLSL